jgi:RNA polymerase sigma-70 factor (ECF subfamily)
MADSTTPPSQGPSKAQDSELIRRFRAGDEQALETLLERYEAPLFQFLVGILHDHHQAEDTLQDTWCRALENFDSVDCDHLRGWLFTVAYHQAILLKRRLKRQFSPPEGRQEALVDPGPGPLSQAEQREELRHLDSILDSLPAGQREVIHRRIYEGKRFREIAEDLDCPLNTALARMHEGLKRLRVLWERTHVPKQNRR